MKKPLFFVLPVLTAVLAVSMFVVPGPKDQVSSQGFSATSARSFITDLATGSTPVYSQAKVEKSLKIVNHLRSFGLEPEVLTSSFLDPASRYGGDIRNILVRIRPGTIRSGLAPVLLLAHYDTVPYGPGAMDNGSGVAVLLEMARVLSRQNAVPEMKREIQLLWTDGEEYAQLGAKSYLRDQKVLPGLVLNLDTFINTPAFLLDSNPDNGGLFSLFSRAGADIRAWSWISAASTLSLPGNNDYAPFKALGIPGASLGSASIYQEYHTSLDVPDLANPGLLQHAGDSVLRLATTAGQSEATTFSGPRQLVMTLPFPGLVCFPVEAVILILGLSLLALLAVLTPGKTGFPYRPGKVLLLALGKLALLAVTLLLALLFDFLKTLVNPDLGIPRYSSHLPGDFLFALAFLALPLALQLFLHLRQAPKQSEADLALAQGIFWNLFSLLSLLVLPGAGFVFVLPAFLHGLGLVLIRFQHRIPFSLVKAVVLASTTLLVLPALIILFQGLGLKSLLLLSFLSFFLFFPLFGGGPRLPRGMVFPAATGALTLVFLVLGFLFVRFDSRYPLPSYLGYTANLDTRKAAWTVLAGANTPWQKKFVPQEDLKLSSLSPFATLIPSQAHSAVYHELPAPGFQVTRSLPGSNRIWTIQVTTSQEGSYLFDWTKNDLVDAIEIQGRTYPAETLKAGEGHAEFVYFTENKAPFEFRMHFRRDLGEDFSLVAGFQSDSLPAVLGVQFDAATLPQNNSCTLVASHRISPGNQ